MMSMMSKKRLSPAEAHDKHLLMFVVASIFVIALSTGVATVLVFQRAVTIRDINLEREKQHDVMMHRVAPLKQPMGGGGFFQSDSNIELFNYEAIKASFERQAARQAAAAAAHHRRKSG